MAVQVRDFEDRDRQDVRRLRYRTFSADEFEPDADEFSIEDDRRVVAEREGRVVGHAGAWRFGQFFGGRLVPMAAVAAVLVEPHARGAGIASDMLARLIDRARDAGDAIATLYPATVRPYRRLGWEYAGLRPQHTVPTRSLTQVAAPQAAVALRPGTADDAEAMRERYLELARHHDGWLALDARHVAYNAGQLHDRGPDEWWVAERDGALTGYVLYSRSSDGGRGNRLTVRELVGGDPDTERALWRLVGGSWTIWPTTVLRGPVAPALAHLLPEEDLHPEPPHDGHSTWSRWMTRLLDLPAAIDARGFPGAADATVHLQVADPWIGANDGAWVLTVRGGRGRLERGGDGSVRIDIGALSASYTGFTSPRTWHRLGRLHCDDAEALDALDGVFRGPTPTALQYF